MATDISRLVAQRDFFSGIPWTPGSLGRRAQGSPQPTTLQALHKATQKQRNIQQLLQRANAGNWAPAAWLAQIGDLTSQLPASAAGRVLYQLAQSYRASGHRELAAESLELLVTDYPDHALTESALLWLLGYWASQEVAWGQSPDQWTRQAAAVGGISPEDSLPTQSAQAIAVRLPGISLEGPADPKSHPSSPPRGQRAARAIQLAESIQRSNPIPVCRPARALLVVRCTAQGRAQRAGGTGLWATRATPAAEGLA